MKKLSVTLFIVIVSYLSMTFFVANTVEKEIKAVLSDNQQADLSIELLSYQKHFFSAIAVSMVTLKGAEDEFSFKVTSLIHHYAHQAVIKNSFELQDEALAKKVEAYFDTPDWISSEEKINLFSKLTGQLTIVAGHYESENESLSTKPFTLDYKADLENKSGDFNLIWAGLTAKTFATTIDLQSLQLTANLGQLSMPSDYDYKVMINNIALQQETQSSLLEGISLRGSSKQGKQAKTIDTSNELLINTYQVNTDNKQSFTDNHIKLALTGLYQPAFELLNNGNNDTQEIEGALTELVNHGAQLTLSQLSSTTPWGEVDGKLNLTLDKGASLTDIVVNPYILFDYMSGNASLILPVSLLDEPSIAEPLQMGLMTGFLERGRQTLNFKTSFQQGELTVNGRVIPL